MDYRGMPTLFHSKGRATLSLKKSPGLHSSLTRCWISELGAHLGRLGGGVESSGR